MAYFYIYKLCRLYSSWERNGLANTYKEVTDPVDENKSNLVFNWTRKKLKNEDKKEVFYYINIVLEVVSSYCTFIFSENKTKGFSETEGFGVRHE